MKIVTPETDGLPPELDGEETLSQAWSGFDTQQTMQAALVVIISHTVARRFDLAFVGMAAGAARLLEDLDADMQLAGIPEHNRREGLQNLFVQLQALRALGKQAADKMRGVSVSAATPEEMAEAVAAAERAGETPPTP